ncbi:MAG: hypothetical protein WC503_06640 [Candidatus Shapirobacteria bacterium]
MISRETVQSFLNQNRKKWGKTPHSDNRDLWSTTPDTITQTDVLTAGMEHSCPVISDVSTKKNPVEMWRSYNGKNQSFEDISNLLISVRPDLGLEWNKKEVKGHSEKTHPEVKKISQFPDGFHKNTLTSNSRMDQYYLSDHFKTLDHIVHGAFPNFAESPSDQLKFSVQTTDYLDCAKLADNLDHFTALVAVRSAQILKSRGISNHSIAKLLALNFAQTGTIRENGQQKHAQYLVDLIIKEIKQPGDLPGLSKEFKKLARPKVKTSYFGQRNPRL